MATILEGDVLVRGNFKADTMQVPNLSVGSAGFNGLDPLAVDKQRHQYSKGVSQAFGTATATKREVIHYCRAAGLIRAFKIGQVQANVGAATVTVTLLKNGSNVLSATLQLTTQVAYATLDGVFSSNTYVAGDVYEVNVTAAAGGGTLGQGFFASLVVDEAES